MSGTAQPVLSEWSPLHHAVFRAVWIATLAANVGTWMQGVGGVWLMTTLSPSPLFIALMQTATSIPVFLVGLPGGALADIMNRRQLLLISQIWILATTAVLSILTFLHLVNVWFLLLLTFMIGVGAMISNPAWQAINSELVPYDELPAAITLTSVSSNLTRAVGPALGGVIVTLAGPGAVFLLNTVAFLYVVIVLYRWHPAPHKNLLPAERMFGAIRTGVRYTLYAPEQHTVMIRTGAFIFFGSGLWALLPIVVSHELKAGSLVYGLLLGFVGLGAVAGAFLLPQIQHRLSVDIVVLVSTILFACTLVGLGFLRNLSLLCVVMFLCGIAWIALVSSFNVAVQEASPSWVRARVLGVYILVFQGATAIGSTVWGAVAGRFGNPTALLCIAIGSIVGLATALRWRLANTEHLDLTPWHASEPKVMIEPKFEEGPILVEIEYSVAPERSHDFIHAMAALRRIRERDGGIRWSLYRDPANPDRQIETFLMESWVEFLRQQDRMTNADHAINDHALSFLEKDKPPMVRALVAEQPTRRHIAPL